MNENDFGGRHGTGAGKPAPAQYSAKEFQLEVLGKLAEMQAVTEGLSESWRDQFKAIAEQKVPKFDVRTLVALVAVALSVAGYVIQDARNGSRQEAEIETMKVRMSNLEQIARTNTEARIRSEVELGQLREGQAEIKRLIQVHDDETKALVRRK